MAQAGVGAEMSNVVGWMDAQAGNGSALLPSHKRPSRQPN